MTFSLSPVFVKKFWMCINQTIPSQLIKPHRKHRLTSYLIRDCCVFEPRWCYNMGVCSQWNRKIKHKTRCPVAAVVMEKWVQVVNNVKVIPECKGLCCCFSPEKKHTQTFANSQKEKKKTPFFSTWSCHIIHTVSPQKCRAQGDFLDTADVILY